MNGRTLGSQLRTLTLGALLGLALACGSRQPEAPPYNDPHPLPEEPLVIEAESIGTHGGRFVIGQLNSPRTFNQTMANETSTLDITHRMFIGLVDFDNAKQQLVPMLAKSWAVSTDGLT